MKSILLITCLICGGLLSLVQAQFMRYDLDDDMKHILQRFHLPNDEWEQLVSYRTQSGEEKEYQDVNAVADSSGTNADDNDDSNPDDADSNERADTAEVAGIDEKDNFEYSDTDDSNEDKQRDGNADNTYNNDNDSHEEVSRLMDWLNMRTYSHNGNNPNYEVYSGWYPTSETSSNSYQPPFELDEIGDDVHFTTSAYQSTENNSPILTANPDHSNLLTKIAESSSNSALLDSEYRNNFDDFQRIHYSLKDSIEALLYDADSIFVDFKETVDSDYNSEEHKIFLQHMSDLLKQADIIRSKIMEMQNVEQRSNYHRLLKALLKEIYGEQKLKSNHSANVFSYYT